MSEKIGIDIIFQGITKKFNKSIDDVKKSSIELSKSFKTAGAVLTGVGVAGIALLANMEKEFSANEKASANLNATFRQNANAVGLMREEITGFAQDFSRSTGIAQADLENASAQMLTFKNVTGETFKEAISLGADLSTVYGQDLKSSTIQLGKALNDPVTGVTALNRVGVQFTEAQKEMIKGFTEQNDLASAQSIILAELRSQVGGATKEFGKTFAGAVAIANNEFAELKAEIVAGVIPVIKDLLNNVIIPLLKWFRELSPETKKLIGLAIGLGTAFATVGGPMLLIIGYLPQISAGFSALGLSITGVGTALGGMLSKLTASVAAFTTAYQLGKKFAETDFGKTIVDNTFGNIIDKFAGTGIEQSGMSAKYYEKANKQASGTVIINNPVFDREGKLNDFQRNINLNQAVVNSI